MFCSVVCVVAVAVAVAVAGFCGLLECLRLPYPSPLCCLTCWLLAGSDGLVFFFSLFLFALPLSLTPPCVDSKRPRVYVQNVPVYTGTTRTCVSSCPRGRFERTRGRRFESTHGVFPVCHTTHPHTHTHTHHNTRHKTQHTTTATTHGDRERDRER